MRGLRVFGTCQISSACKLHASQQPTRHTMALINWRATACIGTHWYVLHGTQRHTMAFTACVPMGAVWEYLERAKYLVHTSCTQYQTRNGTHYLAHSGMHWLSMLHTMALTACEPTSHMARISMYWHTLACITWHATARIGTQGLALCDCVTHSCTHWHSMACITWHVVANIIAHKAKLHCN